MHPLDKACEEAGDGRLAEGGGGSGANLAVGAVALDVVERVVEAVLGALEQRVFEWGDFGGLDVGD